MIITGLFGGMGNQMFQYAVARHISIKSNQNLKLDNSIHNKFYPNKLLGNFKQELKSFNIKAPYASIDEVSRYHTLFQSLPKKIFFHAKKRVLGEPITHEEKYEFDRKFLDLKGDLYLNGLWQSYKYFEDISEIIKGDFSLCDDVVRNLNASMIHSFSHDKSLIGVHVRRTDYLNDPEMFFIGMNYYEQAFAHISQRVKNPKFLIFTDDPAWCSTHFMKLDNEVEIISGKITKSAIEDFYFLQKCRHIIIANSTFSWWAAWLNTNHDKIVVAPKEWFREHKNTEDLIPAAWVRL